MFPWKSSLTTLKDECCCSACAGKELHMIVHQFGKMLSNSMRDFKVGGFVPV